MMNKYVKNLNKDNAIQAILDCEENGKMWTPCTCFWVFLND